MNDVRNALIKLFSQHSCEEIEGSTDRLVKAFATPTFETVVKKPSYESVTALPGYSEEYNLVKAAKRSIELITARFGQHSGDQALQCLCLLKKLRAASLFRTPSYDVTRALIAETLSKAWSAADQSLFDERAQVFDTWSHFFISYTNRDANATNNRYKTLIARELGWPSAAEVRSRNYVARVLAKFLVQEGISGFIDYKVLQSGDELKGQIEAYCRSTVGFVQLVEPEALREPAPPDVNWCYREYVTFAGAPLPRGACAGKGNRRFFVKAGAPLAAPAAGAQLYEDWFADLFDPERSKLAVVMDAHNKAPFDDLRLQLRGIAKQIVAAREELIDSMLASWN